MSRFVFTNNTNKDSNNTCKYISYTYSLSLFLQCESSGKQFVPRLSYPWPGSKIPSETLFKLAASGTGFLATLFYDGVSIVDDHGNYRKMATIISMSIYGIFLLHSIAELLLWFGAPLIKNSDYIIAALGFFWYSLATFYRCVIFYSSYSSSPVVMVIMLVHSLLYRVLLKKIICSLSTLCHSSPSIPYHHDFLRCLLFILYSMFWAL